MKKNYLIIIFAIILNTSFFNNSFSQWVQTNGPYGAVADGVMASGSYVVVQLDDLLGYKITNGGQTWTSLGNGLPLFRENYGFTYLAPNYYISCSAAGVYKSTDNGNNWFAVNNGLPTNSIYRLFSSGNNIFCSFYGQSGIYISTNQGMSWQNAGFGLPYNFSVKRFLQIGETIFLLSSYTGTLDSSGIYSTTNNGNSWIRAANYGLPSNYQINDVTNKSGVLIASIYHNVYKSTNMGNNWQNISGSLPDTGMYDITNDGINIYVNTGLGLYKTTNDGNTWFSVNNGLADVSIRGLLAFNSDLFIPTRWDGIFKSTNGGNSWFQFHNGILNSYVSEIVSINNTILTNSEVNMGIFKTTDNGNNWFSEINGFSQLPDVRSLYVNGTDVFASVNFNLSEVHQVWKSTNNGNSWFNSSTGLPNMEVSEFTSNNSGIFCAIYSYTSNGGVYKSTNNGASWFASGMTSNTKYITSSGSNLIANVNDSDIFISSNSGTSWTRITDGLPMQFRYRNATELKAFNNKVFTSFSISNAAEVYFSSNNGLSWQYRNNGIVANSNIYSFINYNNFIFAGGNRYIYKTNDDGQNWINITSNLSDGYSIKKLAIVGSNIFLGTVASVWRRPLAEVIGIQNISTEIPEGYSLSQNYPNPFNPTTNIEFSLPEKSFVKLKVFDIIGKEVAELVNENLSAGTFRYEFNAGNLPSGIYFYKIESEKFSETKKMIILK